MKNFQSGKTYSTENLSREFDAAPAHLFVEHDGEVQYACVGVTDQSLRHVLVTGDEHDQKWASRVVNGRKPLPVFIRKGDDEYEYAGRYVATQFDDSLERIAQASDCYGNDHVTAVVTMQKLPEKNLA
jgi:hypothetical protein